LFVRESARELTAGDKNHETIHGYQQLEVLIVSLIILFLLSVVFHVMSPWWMFAAPFVYFIWYGLEYAVRKWVIGQEKPYRKVAFEQEAYTNENDLTYLKGRKPFAWVKYLMK
jgi:hypothetical protein